MKISEIELYKWWNSFSLIEQNKLAIDNGYNPIKMLDSEEIQDIWYDEVYERNQILEEAALMARGIYDEYSKEDTANKVRLSFIALASHLMDGEDIDTFDLENWIANNI